MDFECSDCGSAYAENILFCDVCGSSKIEQVRATPVPKKGRVTARKWRGDDAASWAVLIDGRPFVTGLTKREVPHHKARAERSISGARCATCNEALSPVAAMLGPACGACTRAAHKAATGGAS